MNQRNRFAPLSRRGLVLILPLLGLLAVAFFFAGPQPAAQADHDPPVPTPDPPTGVGLRIAYDTGIVLEWDPPPAGSQVYYYLIEITPNDQDDWRSTTYSAFDSPRSGKLLGGFHDLDQGTIYDLRISACLDPNLADEHLAQGAQRCSATVAQDNTRTPFGSPTPVLNLVATPGEQVGLGESGARLTWERPASDGGRSSLSYKVEFKEHSASDYSEAGCTNTTSLQCDFRSGLSSSQDYDFRVAARHDRMSGLNERFQQAFMPRRPHAPENLMTSVGADRVTLSWSRATGGTDDFPIQEYEYQYRGSIGVWTDAGTTSGTTAVVHGLEPRTPYEFRVRSSTVRYVITKRLRYEQRGRRSGWTQSGSVTTLAVSTHVSASPSPLTEANLDGARLTIDLAGAARWEPWAGGAKHRYLIDNGDPERTDDDSPPVYIDRVQRVSDSRVVLTLGYWPNNPKYDFDDDRTLRLTLPTDLHTHTEDFTVSVPVTAIDEQTPGQVTGVTASGGPNNITVSWDPVDGATGYKVQWKQTWQGYDESRQGITRGTTATIPDLNYNTQYDVRVAAFTLKAPADGEWSTSERVRTANVNLFLTPTRTCESDAAAIEGRVVYGTASTDYEGGFFLPHQPYDHQRPPAVSGVDFSHSLSPYALSDTMQFTTDGARQWRGSTSVKIIDDDLVEREETIRIGFAVPHVDAQGRPGYIRLEAEVTIVDDDTLVTRLEPILDENGQQVMQPKLDEDGNRIYRRVYDADGNQVYDDDGNPVEELVTEPAYREISEKHPECRDEAETAQSQETVSVTISTNAIEIFEGQQQTYTVVLDSQPTGFVTIVLTSDNADVTTQPTSLTFSGENWNTAQTVTVSAAQDADAMDDAATITHRVTGGEDVGSVSVTVTDTTQLNRRASVTVTAADPVTVAEGGSSTYTVVLDGEPTGNVVIAMSSDNADVATQPASLTFTPGNWQTAQTVTVHAAHDGDAADDDATISHAVSGADGYAGIAVASVSVAVTDDDEAGVTVSESSLSLEEGDTATYTVVLDTQPTDEVIIYPVAHGEGVTAAPSELIFTSENWQTARTVTVSAPHDGDTEDEQVVIGHDTYIAAPEYASITVASVSVSVTDDDEFEAQPAQQEPENNAPAADAGSDVTVDAGDTVSLDGSGSSDPDGDALTYAWTQTSGPSVTLAGASSATPGFTAPNADATLVFSLTVNDGTEDSAADTVAVTVVAPDPQREALEAFYNTTNGGNWTNNGNWLSDQPLSQWHGVSTNGQGQVTHLSLRNNDLSGSLPTELGNLEALQVLSLDRNSIGGSLPTQLGNLSNLTRLAMNRNSLTGSIPSGLGSLSNLSIIGLARNQLSGALPASLGNLSGLTKLALHDNTALSGALPDGFTNLGNLQRLAIANTGLCAPNDEAFRDWLAGVPDQPGGVPTCE